MLRLSQAITSVYILTVYLGFRRLRARLVWVDGNQVEKLRVALLDTRQTHVTSEQNLGWGVGAIVISTVMTYRLDVLKKFSLPYIHYDTELVHNHHHDIRRCGYEYSTEQNGCFCFYRWEFMDFNLSFRYLQVLGDTMNIPLCGMLPMCLLAMCFDSLSVVTVKYLS